MNYGTIKRQVVVEGNQVAFEAGEQVVIEGIQPNQQNPAFKYVVLSNRLQKRFQLSDNDIQPAKVTQPQQPAPARVPSLQKRLREPFPASASRPKVRRPAFSWRTLVLIGVAVLLIAGLALGLTFSSGTSKKKLPATTWTNTGGAVSTFLAGPLAYDSAHNLLYANCSYNVSPNVYARKGIWKYDGTTWTSIGGAFSTFAVQSLAYDPAHNMLFAGFTAETGGPSGVWKYDGTTWANTGGGVSSYRISPLSYDSAHNLLYAGCFDVADRAGKGVWKYDGTTWTSTGGGVSSFIVEALACDSAHNQLYAAFLQLSPYVCKGVWKYDGSKWSDTGGGFTKGTGNVISSLAYDSEDNLLYSGTNFHGVWKYDGTRWTYTAGGVAKLSISSLAYDSANNLVYAGTMDHGVWKYDGSTWTTTTAGGVSGHSDVALIYDSLHKVLYAGRSLEGNGLGVWKLTEVSGP